MKSAKNTQDDRRHYRTGRPDMKGFRNNHIKSENYRIFRIISFIHITRWKQAPQRTRNVWLKNLCMDGRRGETERVWERIVYHLIHSVDKFELPVGKFVKFLVSDFCKIIKRMCAKQKKRPELSSIPIFYEFLPIFSLFLTISHWRLLLLLFLLLIAFISKAAIRIFETLDG